MASMQDMAVDISVLQSKVKFLMDIVSVTIQVGHPLDPKGTQKLSLPVGKLYQELVAANAEVKQFEVPKNAQDVVDALTEGGDTGANAGGQSSPTHVDGQGVGSPDALHE